MEIKDKIVLLKAEIFDLQIKMASVRKEIEEKINELNELNKGDQNVQGK